jgi:hypothetical protein
MKNLSSRAIPTPDSSGPKANQGSKTAETAARRTNSLPPAGGPLGSVPGARDGRGGAGAAKTAPISRSTSCQRPPPPRTPASPSAAQHAPGRCRSPPHRGGAVPVREVFDDPCRPGAPQARSRLPAWEIWAKKGLPSADRNNKATLLLTGPFRTSKSSAKDLIPRVSKLQYTSARPRVSRGAGVLAF